MRSKSKKAPQHSFIILYTFLRNTYYTEYFIVPQEMKRAVKSGKLYSLAQGRSINFVSRDDMPKAAAVVSTSDEHLYKIYEITAPKAYSYQDIADILTEVSGKDVTYTETTVEAYSAYLDEIGIPEIVKNLFNLSKVEEHPHPVNHIPKILISSIKL